MDVTKDYEGREVATVGGWEEVHTVEDIGAEKEKSTVKRWRQLQRVSGKKKAREARGHNLKIIKRTCRKERVGL